MKDRKDMIQASYYYHKLEMTQQKIAIEMNTSRQRVNRLLKSAIKEGIVDIQIDGFEDYCFDLEHQLRSLLGIDKVVVAKTPQKRIHYFEHVGLACSQLLQSLIDELVDFQIKPTVNIGFSWGTSLQNVFEHFKAKNWETKFNVVQLCGGINTKEISIKPEAITNNFASELNGIPHILYSPAVLKNKDIIPLLKREDYYKKIYSLYQNLDIAVVGIGNLDPTGTLVRYEFLSSNYYNDLKMHDAIGDVCFRMFDSDGKYIRSEFDEHIMGIEERELFNIPNRIGVAYGKSKVLPIISAAKGKFINLLVTDEITARLIISTLK